MNKLLICLSKIFGIYLPFKTTIYNTYYGIILCVIYIIYTSVMIYLQISNQNNDSLTSVIQSFMLMFANFILVARTTLFSREFLLMESALIDIANMNKKIMNTSNATSLTKHNYMLFISAQVIYLVFIVSSYYIWGFYDIFQYILQVLPEYVYQTVFLLQWEILNTLHGSMKCLNENISHCLMDNHNLMESTKEISVVENVDSVHTKLNTILVLVEKHNDIINLYNKQYGWNILFSTLIAMHYLLGFVSELFAFATNNGDNETIFGYLTQLYSLCQGALLPIKCEHIMQQRTVQVNLVQKLVQRYLKYPGLANKLNTLMQQAGLGLNFTAAGFFNVNYAMLFTFVNMTITYLIVIIQFKTNIHS